MSLRIPKEWKRACATGVHATNRPVSGETKQLQGLKLRASTHDHSPTQHRSPLSEHGQSAGNASRRASQDSMESEQLEQLLAAQTSTQPDALPIILTNSQQSTGEGAIDRRADSQRNSDVREGVFAGGYAPRSARAVLRTLELNERLVLQLADAQRKLLDTEAALEKQKELNRKLAEAREVATDSDEGDAQSQSSFHSQGAQTSFQNDQGGERDPPRRLSATDCTHESTEGEVQRRAIESGGLTESTPSRNKTRKVQNVTAMFCLCLCVCVCVCVCVRVCACKVPHACTFKVKKVTAVFVPDKEDPENFLLQFEGTQSEWSMICRRLLCVYML